MKVFLEPLAAGRHQVHTQRHRPSSFLIVNFTRQFPDRRTIRSAVGPSGLG